MDPDDASFAAFAAPDDPFERLADDEVADLPSARHLVAFADAVDAHEWSHARESLDAARHSGVPVELRPHVAVLECVVELHVGDASTAVRIAGEAWREFPDVAALPAALGIARAMSGDTGGAVRALYAAVLDEDPDRTLAVHRRRLTTLLTRVGHALHDDTR